jgi:hypothetical protein
MTLAGNAEMRPLASDSTAGPVPQESSARPALTCDWENCTPATPQRSSRRTRRVRPNVSRTTSPRRVEISA